MDFTDLARLKIIRTEIVEADVIEGVFGAGADEFVGVGEGELFECGNGIARGHAKGTEVQGGARANARMGVVEAGDEEWEEILLAKLQGAEFFQCAEANVRIWIGEVADDGRERGGGIGVR